MNNAKRSSASAPASGATRTSPERSIEQARQQAEQKARPEIEQQRKQTQLQAQETPDREAIAVVDETAQAIQAIAANRTSEAVESIERATGKVNILLARNPAAALIPVSVGVEVIDTAPENKKAIAELIRLASEAVDDQDLPTARALLRRLMSEIRVRTYALPLSTYPDALKEAARLLDRNQPQQAGAVLLTALNTLMVIDRVSPIPLLVARATINKAEELQQKDKNESQKLLKTAREQIERSKDLGYSGSDPEYSELKEDISALEKQLRGDADVKAVFSKLKDKLSAFFKRQFDDEPLSVVPHDGTS